MPKITEGLPAGLPLAGPLQGTDVVVGAQDGHAVRIPVDLFVGPAGPTGPTGEQGDTGATGEPQLSYATWALLSARGTGDLTDGSAARVLSDAGVHTDPVVGGTVNNQGVYSWHPAAPIGWLRIAALDTDAAAASAASAAASASAAAAYALTPDLARDIDDPRHSFRGTGRIAVWVRGGGTSSFGQIGDGITGNVGAVNLDRFNQHVGNPCIVLAKEDSAQMWWGAIYPTFVDGSGRTTNYRSTYAWFRPAKRIRYDNAIVVDGNGGSVGYPMTATTGYTEADLHTLGAVNFVGLSVGWTGNNNGVAKITLTDTDTAASVTPNLIATAQQAVNRAQCPSTALVANGGTLAPSDRIISGTINDTNFIWSASIDVPVWSGDPEHLKIRATYTGEHGQQQSVTTVDRFYSYGFTYSTTAMDFGQAGVEPVRADYAMNWLDSSANDEMTIGGKPTASAGATILNMGGGHGFENQTSIHIYKNGVEQCIFAKSATFSRTSGVCTAVFATPHGIIGTDANKLVTFSGFPELQSDGTTHNPMGGSNITRSETEITVTDAYTASWNTATVGTALVIGTYDPDVALAAYTTGFVKRHEVIVGTADERIEMVRTSELFHTLTGATVVATKTVRDVITSAGIETSRELVFAVDFTLGTGAYPALETIASGSRTNWGPEFQGDDTTYRILGQSTKNSFNSAGVQTDHAMGQIAGVVAWRAATGRAVAVSLKRPNLDTAGWWGGGGAVLAQERVNAAASNGTTLVKHYFRLTPTTKAYLAGDRLVCNTYRFEHAFPPAAVKAVLDIAP